MRPTVSHKDSILLRFSLFLMVMTLALAALAQPGNPSYSLSANTYLELELQPIALLDIETSQANSNFSMTVDVPTEAGEGFGTNPLKTNNDNWINYSSGVQPTVSRKVQASINSGTVPAGFEIRLSVGNATGSGGGVLGTPLSGYIAITSSPQDIIDGIRGAYTGDGPSNGHRLTYALHHTGGSFSALEQQSTTVNVLFTIIDY